MEEDWKVVGKIFWTFIKKKSEKKVFFSLSDFSTFQFLFFYFLFFILLFIIIFFLLLLLVSA